MFGWLTDLNVALEGSLRNVTLEYLRFASGNVTWELGIEVVLLTPFVVFMLVSGVIKMRHIV